MSAPILKKNTTSTSTQLFHIRNLKTENGPEKKTVKKTE